MSLQFSIAEDSPDPKVDSNKQFDLAQEEEEGASLLEEERRRQELLAAEDSEKQESSNQSNRLNEGSRSLNMGPIKEEESNIDPHSSHQVAAAAAS